MFVFRPVIIEVPHFASLRGKEREIVILRSENGETWREHSIEATEEAIHDALNGSFEGEGDWTLCTCAGTNQKAACSITLIYHFIFFLSSLTLSFRLQNFLTSFVLDFDLLICLEWQSVLSL